MDFNGNKFYSATQLWKLFHLRYSKLYKIIDYLDLKPVEKYNRQNDQWCLYYSHDDMLKIREYLSYVKSLHSIQEMYVQLGTNDRKLKLMINSLELKPIKICTKKFDYFTEKDFEKLRKMTEIGKQFRYFTRKNLDKMKEMMEG